jgi:hypothetical protein
MLQTNKEASDKESHRARNRKRWKKFRMLDLGRNHEQKKLNPKKTTSEKHRIEEDEEPTKSE